MKANQVDRSLGLVVPPTLRERVWWFLAHTSLSEFRWGRRWLGGNWALWWIGSPVNGFIWAPDAGKRLPLGTICGREAWS